MTERSHAQHYGHIFLLAYLKESAQAPLTIPAEDALTLFDMIPEHVGSHNGHPTLLHFPHLTLPLVDRQTGIVDFAHDGTDASAVYHQPILVPFHLRNSLAYRQASHEKGYRQQPLSHKPFNPDGTPLEWES